MQENWSLILNTLLLIGVIIAIVHMIKSRRHSVSHKQTPVIHAHTKEDDIIAVRKVDKEAKTDDVPVIRPVQDNMPDLDTAAEKSNTTDNEQPFQLMMFLLAKHNRQFAGYELLQTLLAAGLRFGEGHLFHRHQHISGKGPVLCSLAAATASGVFDLQNLGAFSVRGLCLFMQASGNASIDAERFAIMLETARQLSDDLDAHLLDDKQQALTDERLRHYQRQLNITDFEMKTVS